MNKYEENLIADVLHFTHLASLPKKADKEKSIWIEAIAKIRLSDNTVAYGVVKRNPDLSYRVTYVKGSTAVIADIEEVYPYVVLEKEYIKKFGPNTNEKHRIAYLRQLNLPYAESMDFDSMTLDELNKEVVKAAVYQQIKALEE